MKQLLNKWQEDTMSPEKQVKIVEKKLEETTEKPKQLADIKAYLLDKLTVLKQTADSRPLCLNYCQTVSISKAEATEATDFFTAMFLITNNRLDSINSPDRFF